jgi:hypothetical protein
LRHCNAVAQCLNNSCSKKKQGFEFFLFLDFIFLHFRDADASVAEA